MPRMLEHYQQNVVPALMKRFNYKNRLQVPRLEKVVVNAGVGEAIQEPKLLEAIMQDIATIAGQRPAITKARRSISNFKLRAGTPIGCRVTLRSAMMYEFIDRLINVAIPRVRDFRGLSADSFDGRGNYSMGITEQIIFPEIDYDKVQRIMGMNITIVTTAASDDEAFELLRGMGMPFRGASR
ncbi:50S ribosomal protein L5 [candidate division TA06 bacterium DG_24]|uniref:Large ribosomal subunit protein uL5 n=3 Tax=Bacteria division TA06 TaxID=1156500 RepID=A0A0S8JIT1_UNCT6|nr:MAG: 50S ribosomal protein L5 [candidate division TA06 bacterium DG_24]KPK70902.1 MAG: 50S ribosomal protein L5 [candidate division TA06 bacterium SM23_40]KPL09576.1 MAG: 50S ribosomal protein L5 [candidate division TA06 bacterium SM1_40]